MFFSEEKPGAKTPKAKRSIIDFNKTTKNDKNDKNDGNVTERKAPSTTKTLLRNKTTANFNTSRKTKEDDEKPKDSEKTVNQNISKPKRDNLQPIPETSIFTFNL